MARAWYIDAGVVHCCNFPMTFPLQPTALFQWPCHCIFRQWRALLGQRHYRQFWISAVAWRQALLMGNATIDNFGPSTQQIRQSRTNGSTECSAACRCRQAKLLTVLSLSLTGCLSRRVAGADRMSPVWTTLSSQHLADRSPI